MNDLRAHFKPLPFALRVRLAAHERVLDRLTDLLLDADEVLDMLRAEDARSMQWLEPHLRQVYEEVDDMVKGLCD